MFRQQQGVFTRACIEQGAVQGAVGIVDAEAAAERIEIYGTDVLPALERNLERIARAYDLGELNIHQVSQTRARVIETQMRALEALRDYYRTVENLEAAVGTEPWPISEETP